MRHNKTEILNQLSALAEKYPFNQADRDKAERLMNEFEEAILQKLTENETLEFTIRLFALNEPKERKHKEV